MKRHRDLSSALTLIVTVLLMVAVTSCTRLTFELPTPTSAVVPSETAVPTSIRVSTPRPTQTIESDGGEVELAAREFFDWIRKGDIEQALSYWDLQDEDTLNFKRIAKEWHDQGFMFSVGEVSYSGFVAPGDYRDLEEGDPRANNARVEVVIGDQDYYLMLTQVNGEWRMNGLLVRE